MGAKGDKINIVWKGIPPSLEMQSHLERQLAPIANYAKTISEITKPHMEMAQRITDSMKPHMEMAQRITDSMKPHMEMLQRISNSVKLVENTYLKSLTNWLPPLFDKKLLTNLSKLAQEYNSQEYKKFEKEWGWAINGKSIQLGDYLYGLYKKNGSIKFKSRINKMFYHKTNTDFVLRDIKKKFPERHHIIREAFNLHLQRKYASSIILMLPQVEGILWDLGMKRGIVRRGYNSNFLKGGKRKQEIKKISSLSKKIFKDDKFHNIIAVDIFAEGFRNKVLHGRNIYLKKEREISRWKSTLLILTLWRLFDEFN